MTTLLKFLGALAALEIAYVTYAYDHHTPEKTQHHQALLLAAIWLVISVVIERAVSKRKAKTSRRPSGYTYGR